MNDIYIKWLLVLGAVILFGLFVWALIRGGLNNASLVEEKIEIECSNGVDTVEIDKYTNRVTSYKCK